MIVVNSLLALLTAFGADCPEVYDRLINDRNFPMAVQFDWTKY